MNKKESIGKEIKLARAKLGRIFTKRHEVEQHLNSLLRIENAIKISLRA